MAAMRIALRALRVDIAASTRSPLDGTYDTGGIHDDRVDPG
jgi:hypothetical protein